MLLYPRSKNQELGFGPDIPKSFSSLEEARNSLDFQWNGCLRVQEAEATTESRLEMTERFFGKFQSWSAAFHAFLKQSGSKLSSRDLKGAAVLSLSRRYAAMHFDRNSMAFSTDQTGWDQYGAEHEGMVSLAATILEASDNTTGASSGCAPSFSLDMHIIAPLYCVAHRCRDPVIRRKAISLLYATPRQEGIWNSILTARVAQRLMEIEEAGLGRIQSCSDVPEWARITGVNVQFDLEECQATIEYGYQGKDLRGTMRPITDIIQW